MFPWITLSWHHRILIRIASFDTKAHSTEFAATGLEWRVHWLVHTNLDSMLVFGNGGSLGEFLRGEKYDKALPPVAVIDLKAVLDKDIAEALKSGELAPSTGADVSVAVMEHRVSRVFSYGAAKPDSIYEIGSITKTFTGLMLSQMVEQVRFASTIRSANCWQQA